MEYTKNLYVTFPMVRTKPDCQIVADFSQRNYVVGEKTRRITEQECRANANLFAAAPELLEALKDLLEEIPTETWESFPEYIQKQAINAIARAEGK